MKKLLKVVGFSVLFFLVLIVSIGLYSLHKSSTFDDFLLMTDTAVDKISSIELAALYNVDSIYADRNYRRKVVVVSGPVLDFTWNEDLFFVVLNGMWTQRNIKCQIQDRQVQEVLSNLRRGEFTMVAGTVVGLIDDTITEVYMIDCLASIDEWTQK